MEALLSELKLRRVERAEEIAFLNGSVYIWVIHANKIPPHIGVSHGDAFFSLKANGKDEGLPLQRILPILKSKRIATLFFEVRPDEARAQLDTVFHRFDKTHVGTTTCLEPLKEIFGVPNATKVMELLEVLEQRGVLVSQSGWLLPDSFDGIQDYSNEAIHARLKSLEND